mgnify:CR=1 FL=1
MLQAMRFCLAGAGEKMSPAIRKQILPTLLDLLGSTEDSTRSVASGCVGILSLILPDVELTDLLIQQLLGNVLQNVLQIIIMLCCCYTFIFQLTCSYINLL